MTNKEIFIETVEALFSHTTNSIPQAAIDYFETLKGAEVDTPKQPFTEVGASILIWMQDNHILHNNIFRAKTIAEGMFAINGSPITSRTVSGSMRKLVTDGYVSKVEGNPVSYSLTDLGKEITVVIPEPKAKKQKSLD